MTEDMFQALVGRLCEAAGLPNKTLVQQNAMVLVDGWQVALSAQHEPDALGIRVNLGPAPAGREQHAYRLLLEMNGVACTSRTGQIWIDASSGHVIFNFFMPVARTTTGAHVIEVIDRVLKRAQHVRELAL